MGGLINASKPFAKFGEKAESFIANRYPNILESGNIQRVHIGRNKDASPGERGFRITGAQATAGGNYLETPDKILPTDMIQNEKAKAGATCVKRVSDSARNAIQEMEESFIKQGLHQNEARQRVKDSVQMVSYFDTKDGVYVTEPVVKRVNDSLLSGLAVPYWNVSHTNKVFKQPFIAGVAKNLVDTWGIPNVWADALVMYAESFEGSARVSSVAKANVEINDSATVSNRMDQLVSTFVNFVVDYETGMQEAIMGSQQGNPLTSMAIGDREKYARLMIEQLYNAALLFGAPEAGFDGLSQLATTNLYGGTPFNAIFSGASATKGADMIEAINLILGNAQEALSFLPTSVRINVSPTMYKCLKYAMHSKVYNPSNPLTVLKGAFPDTEKIVSPGGFIKGLDFNLVSDPFCAAHTPWNDNASDLMFITFPSVKSALEDMDSLIIAPTAIENYILPSYPQRDGLTRTMLKRAGGLIAPVSDTVLIYRGIGVQ